MYCKDVLHRSLVCKASVQSSAGKERSEKFTDFGYHSIWCSVLEPQPSMNPRATYSILDAQHYVARTCTIQKHCECPAKNLAAIDVLTKDKQWWILVAPIQSTLTFWCDFLAGSGLLKISDGQICRRDDAKLSIIP